MGSDWAYYRHCSSTPVFRSEKQLRATPERRLSARSLRATRANARCTRETNAVDFFEPFRFRLFLIPLLNGGLNLLVERRVIMIGAAWGVAFYAAPLSEYAEPAYRDKKHRLSQTPLVRPIVSA
jgi:hypothetical protein